MLGTSVPFKRKKSANLRKNVRRIRTENLPMRKISGGFLQLFSAETFSNFSAKFSFNCFVSNA